MSCIISQKNADLSLYVSGFITPFLCNVWDAFSGRMWKATHENRYLYWDLAMTHMLAMFCYSTWTELARPKPRWKEKDRINILSVTILIFVFSICNFLNYIYLFNACCNTSSPTMTYSYTWLSDDHVFISPLTFSIYNRRRKIN